MTRQSGRLVFSALVAVAATSCTGGADSGPTADLVLTNGIITTVDPNLPEAEAVAVLGAHIVAVGTSDEVASWVGQDTEVIDLEGRRAIPGFVESHGHFLGLGRAKMILDLTEGAAPSWQAIVDMVADAASRAQPGQWINGRGWHQEKWTSVPEPNVDGVPLHAALSAVSPDNPVLLGHASGHAAFANAAALAAAGIDGTTADPPGGTIVRDENGEPTGLLRETAQRLVSAAQAAAESGRSAAELEAEFVEMVRLAGEEALSKGVTSFHDAGTGFDAIERFAALDDSGNLPIRLSVMVRGSNDEMAEKLSTHRRVAEGNGHLTVRSIKRQIDGALGSHGAWLLEPYEDLPSSAGLNLEEVDDIRRTADLAIINGYQLNTHAIGDRANREVLDIYRAAFAEAGVNDTRGLRWRIEHAQHLERSDIDRFVEMGIIAAVQGVHATSDGPWIPDRIGDDRSQSGAYLWRDMIDAGVVITNGTDVPVEDINPIRSFYSTVSRMTNEGERFYPAQAMTRMEALESYTINGAFAEFAEDQKGSITQGKLADIVVLSADILTIPEEQIPATVIDLTIVGGDVRYRRDTP